MKYSTIDTLVNQLLDLKAIHGGDAEVITMQYSGGNDEPCYVKAIEPSSESMGRVLIESTFYV